MSDVNIKKNADRILYEFGLLKKLEELGTVHIIGSYRMDMMAWNDLDVDIENDSMSLEKLYNLSAFVMNTFTPSWYEAKEEITDEGKKVWFQGFETSVTGELWNVDLWFFDKETINSAELYCDSVVKKTTQIQRKIIIDIKKKLINRGLYSFEKYNSMDVYKAVIKNNVKNITEFLNLK